MYTFWILLVIIIIICSLTSIEHFEINDFYSRYLQDISVPSDFYSQPKYATNYKFVEFNDKFFTDVLTKNTQNSDIIGTITNKYPDYLLQSIEKHLLKIFNSELKDDTNLFVILESNIKDVKVSDNKYIINSQHVVYRESKIYGAAIELSTLYDKDNITIIKSKLLGFIFQDRLNPIQPSNLASDNHQEYMLDKVITKDPKYEKQFLCQYYKDLEKFKGLKVNSGIDCDS
jgi:hypothetical protein